MAVNSFISNCLQISAKPLTVEHKKKKLSIAKLGKHRVYDEFGRWHWSE